MSELNKRFDALVGGTAFSPPPLATIEAELRRRHHRRVIAVAACLCVLIVIAASALVMVRTDGSTNLAVGDGSATGTTQESRSSDVDCTFIGFWDIAQMDRDSAARGSSAPLARPIIVGRVGASTGHTSRTAANIPVRLDTETRSFTTWRTLAPIGTEQDIASIATQQQFPTSPGVNNSDCFDQDKTVHLTEGQVVVTFATQEPTDASTWQLPSRTDAVYFAVRPDGTPPTSAANLDDSNVTVRNAAGESACHRHDPCTLSGLQQELNALSDNVRPCDSPNGSLTDVANEPPRWRTAAQYQTWATANGCELRIDALGDRSGAQHCGWQNARVIVTGSPVGALYSSPTNTQTFVRDPQGAFGHPELTAGFDPHATLPPGAQDTGFRLGDTQLWTDPADPTTIYLKATDTVERWPRGTEPLCS